MNSHKSTGIIEDIANEVVHHYAWIATKVLVCIIECLANYVLYHYAWIGSKGMKLLKAQLTMYSTTMHE